MAPGKFARRLTPELRFQPDLVAKLKNKISDPVLSQAQMLKLLPLGLPTGLKGESEGLAPVEEEGNQIDELDIFEAEAGVTVELSSQMHGKADLEEQLGDAMTTAMDSGSTEDQKRRPTQLEENDEQAMRDKFESLLL